MPTIFTRKKYNALSTLTVILLSTASLIGLNACSSGGGSAPLPSVTITGGSVVEGDTGTQMVSFTVNTSVASTASTTVVYATSDGTATAGTDYTANTGTLTIPAGSTSASITVDVTGDTAFEFDETITMTLSSPSGLTLGTTSSATGTITDDDDADTKGYFTGTANVNSTPYADMMGIAHNGRLMVFSPTANVLYDITITNVSTMDFTGTVDVYVNGGIQAGVTTVSGTTNESQVQGTFAGVGATGFEVGSFDILFDTQNNRSASFTRMSTNNQSKPGNVYGYYTDTGLMRVNSVGAYVGSDDGNPQCGFVNNYNLPGNSINVYLMAHDITDSINCGFISPVGPPLNHSGFASVIDTSATDDTIVFAFSDGSISLFGIIDKT